MNILSRLFSKTLHLLKLVSKDWLNLISDRSFISLQLKKSEPISVFFFQDEFEWIDQDVRSITYIPIPSQSERVNVHRSLLDFLPEKVVIMSLNNGLICCSTSFPNSNPMIYVFNPLNKQWRSLKWPNHIPKDCCIALAFDPFRDPIDVSTDFNLVAVSRIEVYEEDEDEDEDDDEGEEEEEYSFVFDIYSSKTRSWRRSNEFCGSNHEINENRGVLANGVLYWLADEGYEVLMFDHRNELSCLIPSPIPKPLYCTLEMCIGESEGKLHYVVISEHELELWILEDCFAAKWDLKFCASLEELVGKTGLVMCKLEERLGRRFLWEDDVLYPFCFKDGVALLRIATHVYLYEFDTRRMRELCNVSDLGRRAMSSPIAVPYTMSLVPVEQA